MTSYNLNISKATEKDLENNILETHQKYHTESTNISNSSSFVVLSCISYIFTGVSMVLLNKAISYNIAPHVKAKLPEMLIITFQCVTALTLVVSAKALKIVEYPSFSFETARGWLPVNILFIGTVCTGFASLVYVSVPIVTVFKNLSHIGTTFGDWYIFNEKYAQLFDILFMSLFITRTSWLSVQAIILMIIGAAFAALNDLEFNLFGYFLMTINCIISALYILYMRFATMSIKLPRFGMVYYNNLISAMILLPICFIKGEFKALNDPEIMTNQFIIYNILAGILGFFLNFASLWCIESTSATAFAVIGSFNKVPVTILGFLLFKAKMTFNGIIFVILATLGSFLYAYTKLQK